MGTKEKKAWYFISSLKGDKVIWSIVLMLILLSLLFVFSSVSKKGLGASLATIQDQLVTVAIGITAIIVAYNLKIGWIKNLSRWGFWFSFIFLVALHIFGTETNEARRYIEAGPIQIHVLEMVKVAIIMYIAWVADAFDKKKMLLTDKLAQKFPKLAGLQNPRIRTGIYIYAPFLITELLVMSSSNTTALVLGLIMMITIGVVTREYKLMLGLCGVLCAGVLIMFGVYQTSLAHGDNPPKCQRIGTAINRIVSVDNVEKFKEADNATDRQKALDKIRQPYSARIAIHQGKLFGKGPGQSTQKYVVPIMAEDYMFSFIVEEYGLVLGVWVMILYLSLMARGVLVIRNCGTDIFAISTIFGLVLLISGQAFIHILVNMDFGLLTGQTLPLLSHGSFAFICFCIAFGIILSISKVAHSGMEKMTQEAAPLVPVTETKDEVRDALEDLDSYDL